MAKRDRYGWARDHINEIMACRGLPATPLAAYLYRRYRTVNDALRHWRIDSPRADVLPLNDARQRYIAADDARKRLPPDALRLRPSSAPPGMRPSIEELMALNRRIRRLVDARLSEYVDSAGALVAALRSGSAAARRDAADRLLVALGSPPDYARGRGELAEILTELGPTDEDCSLESLSPGLFFRVELESEIPPLLSIYEKPQIFFRDIAPRVWPFDFAELGADTSVSRPHPGVLAELVRPELPPGMSRPIEVVLLRCLWRWGLGVLSNPHVRRTFETLPEDKRGEILSILDERVTFSDGRPQGSGLTPEETREMYESALAHVDDTTPKERAEDRSIYGDMAAPKVPPGRNPSKESAARELASRDLGTSRRSLRRHLRKAGESPD